MWHFDFELDAAQGAELKAGRPLIYRTIPAAWTSLPLWRDLKPSSGETIRLAVAPSPGDVLDLARQLFSAPQAGRIHPAFGAARACRLLTSRQADVVVATVPDARQLFSRSCLTSERVESVMVCWPEDLDTTDRQGLEDLLGELRGIQRIFVSHRPEEISELLERQAFRALTAEVAAPPSAPSGRLHYTLTGSEKTIPLRLALDALNPSSTLIWQPNPDLQAELREFDQDSTVRISERIDGDPVAWAVALDLPTPSAAQALQEIAGDTLVLIRPRQLSSLEAMAALKPLKLASALDRQRAQAQRIRRAIRDRIDGGLSPAGILALEPLLDEFDPAMVAAAALSLRDESPAVESRDAPSHTKIFVNTGRRDRTNPGQLVGILINEVKLPKDSIGKIDIRENYSLIEVNSEDAQQAIDGLTGLNLRGRRLIARLDQR